MSSPPIDEGTTVEEIMDAYPGVLQVLEEFGIRIDPWTLIALKATVKELAEYSAVRYPAELERAIQEFVEANPA